MNLKPTALLTFKFIGATVLLLGLFGISYPAATQASTSSTCSLTNPAFCDTFDQPMSTGNRSGALNGTVWGVSRLSSYTNPYSGPSNGWFASIQQQSTGSVSVLPENDVNVVGGQLVESINDGGTINSDGSGGGGGADVVLAAYPKQPFDNTNRTGKVTFDVNSDTAGPHGAWPTFVWTNLPVPAPGQDNAHVPAIITTPQNSFGFSLAQRCDITSNAQCQNCPNTGQTTVDHVWITTNYVQQDLAFTVDGCVTANLHETVPGPLNHFELDISPSGFVLYGTDAGSSTLKEVADANLPALHAANSAIPAVMPLTRGLIWLEDVHYNADKFCGQQPGNEYYPVACQGDHTFAWDNVGFDGPVLARDLSEDVLDANQSIGSGQVQLGWNINSGNTAALTTQSATAADVTAASAAIITLNVFPTSEDALTYTVNGHPAHSFAWPFPDGQGYAWRTEAMPVPLSELQAGANTLTVGTSGIATIANVDLKLVGAGGVPNCFNPSNCAGSMFAPPASVCKQAIYINDVGPQEGAVIACP